ncbi:ABC transporter ATP-binding protein [Microbacteriaceae bacterium K1510]|nr:ABC transporter ATP-binding protein [Microbacteriaceae bacterium K1510]
MSHSTSATGPILAISGLMKRFGGITATDEVHLDVQRRETHALIGPNGAGKTTLIALIQGDLQSDAGQIAFNGREITDEPAYRRAQYGIARSFQITSIFPDFTVLENVLLAVQGCVGHSFRFWRKVHDDDRLTVEARAAVELIGLTHRLATLAKDLSYGERRQLELAMAIAMRPALLLLDEPMAGIGRRDAVYITQILAGLKSRYAILLVEHDMNAVFSLADRVSVLVSGRCIATGTPSEIRADPVVQASYLGHRR